MPKTAKRLLIALLLAALVCAVAAGAFVALKKAGAMYWNLYAAVHDTADRTVDSVDEFIDDMRQVAYPFDYAWTSGESGNPPLIAHAFGGIDGQDYTNSLEAFEANYALGHRIFEVDFGLSSDGHHLLALHDEDTWRSRMNVPEGVPYTLDTFLNPPFEAAYTALDYQAVVQLMVEHPDIYIVTDTKHTDVVTTMLKFSQLIRYANSFPGVTDRIIPQIYHEDMLDWVMTLYPFKSVIFTLYATGWTPESVYNFCKRSGIRFITLFDFYITPEIIDLWDRLGITVAVHTVNDADQANAYYDMGVDLIYTDFLTPEDVRR